MANQSEQAARITAVASKLAEVKTKVDSLVASQGQVSPELVTAVDGLETAVAAVVAAFPADQAPAQ